MIIRIILTSEYLRQITWTVSPPTFTDEKLTFKYFNPPSQVISLQIMMSGNVGDGMLQYESK